jgi:hypothetical protein
MKRGKSPPPHYATGCPLCGALPRNPAGRHKAPRTPVYTVNNYTFF